MERSIRSPISDRFFAAYRSPSSIRIKPSSAATSCRRLNADEAITVKVRSDTHRRRPGRPRPPRRLRHSRDPQGHGAAGPAGREGADRGLCRRGLFPSLQPDPAGHIGGRRDRLHRHRDARRAQRGQPRLCGDDPQRLADRFSLPTAVQPDRRLRQLCRARRLHPHPATDAAAGRRVARRRGLRARRPLRTAGFDPERAPFSARRSRISASRCRDLRSI